MGGGGCRGDERTRWNEASGRLDAIIQGLIEADQRGSGMEPIKLAHELGEPKLLLARRRTIRPRPGGEGHWRCEACGTITPARARPAKGPQGGPTRLWPPDPGH